MTRTAEDGKTEAFIRSFSTYRGKSMPREKEYALIAQAQKGSEKALEALLRHYAPLILQIAKRFRRKGCDLTLWDLFSEGQAGFTKAINRFDLSKGFRLTTYSVWWIRQATHRAAQDKGKTIRIPVHAQEFAAKVRAAEFRIKKRDCDAASPTDEEIVEELIKMCKEALAAARKRERQAAKATGGRPPTEKKRAPRMTKKQRERLLNKVHTVRVSPSFALPAELDAPSRIKNDEEGNPLRNILEERIAEDGIERTSRGCLGDKLQKQINALPERERKVIIGRLIEERTLEEIAQDFTNPMTGKPICRERVRQIEAQALERLRKALRRFYRQHRAPP